MSETKHTPGPWDALSHDFGRKKVWEVVAGPEDRTIVALNWFSTNAELDAKLIAAAPDMLAACELALEDMVRWKIFGPGRNAVESAIKKAKGNGDE